MLTSFIGILTPITTQATKLALGESVTVLLTMDFIPRSHLVAIISKRSVRRNDCLYEICIIRKQ